MKVAVIILYVLLAHDWYPATCCGGHDCHVIPCNSAQKVKDEPPWWRIEAPHAIGGYAYYVGDPAESPDSNCHVCQVHPSSAVRCLFMPQATS